MLKTNARLDSAELRQIFVNDISLIDVRAPVEFERGAVPMAANLPILTNAEREEVGVTFKRDGQDAAVALGHRLVSGSVKNLRVGAWIKHLERQPESMLYCFRGGQRSELACDWLKSVGYSVPRIAGGYKRLRNFLLAQFENLPPLVLVSGQTGVGKTRFLSRLDRKIDLEGHANHRGSAFGGKLTPQPAQIDFENRVAIDLLKLGVDAEILVEDEGRLIGRVNLPPLLQAKMATAPILVIEDTLQNRAQSIFEEYIEAEWQTYQAHFPENAAQAFETHLLNAVDAIRKRLGGVAHSEIRAMVVTAMDQQRSIAVLDGHQAWIEALLSGYYDPMYDYQLNRKSARVIFRGTMDEVFGWYEQNSGSVTGSITGSVTKEHSL